MDTYNMIDFNEKKGFICDMDGVIYHGNQILPGVAEFIQWLQGEGKEYLFLTNNSGYTPRELHQKLARMGLEVPEEHFYTSALATAAFLKEQAPLMTAALERCGVPCVYRCYGDETQKLGHVFHCNIRAEAAQNCNTEECGFFKRFME